MASVYLHIAPPFVLIRVMQLLVYTNTSCLYKRIEPRYIRLTKIVIFDDTLCILTQKLAVILFWTFQLIVYSIPFHRIDLATLFDIYYIPVSLLQTIILL